MICKPKSVGFGRIRQTERDLRVERRIALLRRKHHDNGAFLDAAIEIDDILIGQADAAGRNRRADIFRLVGAVDAIQRVLVPS